MKSARWYVLLFPTPPRSFPGRRTVKITLRAVHVLCAALLVGSHLLQTDPEVQYECLLATAASGLLILLLDLHESAAFLVQVRGLFVIVKVASVALLPLLGGGAGLLLAALLLLSVVMSHAPSGLRYYVLLGRGRVQGSCSKG